MANGLLDDDSWLERLQRGYSGTTGLLNQQLGDYAGQLNQARLAATEPVNQALGGYPRQAADALSSVAGVPGSEMMMPLPMTAFTASELGYKMPRDIKTMYDAFRGRGDSAIYNPGVQKLMEQVASGELEEGLVKMAERYKPSVIRPMGLEADLGGVSEGAYFPQANTVAFYPDIVLARAAEGELPSKFLEQIMGHETGHGALRKGTQGIKSLSPYDTAEFGKILARNNLTNPARFQRILENLRGTELGDILETYFRGEPNQSLLNRADYWRYKVPQGRLPFEEYYADALGGRAANVGGTELLPIDWSYLDPFFK